ncbi:DUF3850 domain-containing protein [Robinsoniella peoriensis]|uniref:DUF3850 domain-containing protein n=1 Tax=Robinsoniella peoriensis TaxID=180332 RepID=UPI00363CA1A5
MGRIVHNLKLDRETFLEVGEGKCRFLILPEKVENYSAGDLICSRANLGSVYKPWTANANLRVTYVLPESDFLVPGYCVVGFILLEISGLRNEWGYKI